MDHSLRLTMIAEADQHGQNYVYTKYNLDKQQLCNVLWFRDIPKEAFETLDLSDTMSFAIEQTHAKTWYDRAKIKMLLKDYTMSEIITGVPIKIDKSKNYGHVNMNSSIL